MNRKGFISVMALLVMTIVFMNVAFLSYMGNLQMAISGFSTLSIKSNYIVEDLINRIIYDEEIFDKYYKKHILNQSRNISKHSFKNKKINMKDEGFKSCIYSIEDRKEGKMMNLKLKSDIYDIENNVDLDILLLNYLFESNKPLINMDNLEHNKKDVFESYLNSIEENIFDYDSIPNSNVIKNNIYGKVNIVLDDDTNRNIIYNLENDIPKNICNFTNETLILNFKNRDIDNLKKAQLILGKLEDIEKMNIRGVLYIKGDLIINQNLDFDGIIIIDNGSLYIYDDINVNIRGMMLHRNGNILNMENLNLEYNQANVYMYGSYLPKYIDPEIVLLKKY